MKRVLFLQLDGKWPNLALMRASASHRSRGDEVELRQCRGFKSLEALAVRFEGNDSLLDQYDYVYASLIFTKTGPLAERLLELRPDAFVGGSGWDDYPAEGTRVTSLEEIGIFTLKQDYSLYPNFTASVGFTERGCRMNARTCPFCSVPRREGKVRAVATVGEIWRGEPYPKHLLLLDNDTFGQPDWRRMIEDIREGGFKVCWNQGINARMLNDETAAAIASVRYVDDDFKTKRLYTAWDNRDDERVLLRGLEALKRAGLLPDDIMVYMIIGYWPGQGVEEWESRRRKIREFGARPYPMPYERAYLTVGYQRWVLGAFDKTIPWEAWKLAKMQPANLGARDAPALFEMR